MMMIAPSVYRPTFKICKEGGKLLVQSRIRKGFPVEFETYFSLTSDIFHGIWALCSFHKIHPASKEGSDFWVKTVIIAFLKISSNYAMTYFCRGSHHGSQIGQSRNSVKFASPTHHRYSAASDNLGKENKIIVIINNCDALMVRSHPEMVQFLFLKRNSKMHPVSTVSVPSCALYNHIGAIASKINGFKDLLFWQIFLSPIHDLWIFIATLWLVELHGLATLWLVEIWCNPPEIGSQSRVKQFR